MFSCRKETFKVFREHISSENFLLLSAGLLSYAFKPLIIVMALTVGGVSTSIGS